MAYVLTKSVYITAVCILFELIAWALDASNSSSLRKMQPVAGNAATTNYKSAASKAAAASALGISCMLEILICKDVLGG